MSRRLNGQSVLDRALAVAYPNPEDRETARRAFLRKPPHERDEIRRQLNEAFGITSSAAPAASTNHNTRTMQ